MHFVLSTFISISISSINYSVCYLQRESHHHQRPAADVPHLIPVAPGVPGPFKLHVIKLSFKAVELKHLPSSGLDAGLQSSVYYIPLRASDLGGVILFVIYTNCM